MDIRIKIVPNPLYGTESSLVENPYKGEVIHTGTVTAADVCEACKEENPQMTEPLASLATETILDYGSDKVVTDVVRFNLGSAFFTLEPAVSGSVPTVDAPLSDENERTIRVVNGQSLNARIAALKPVIVGDDLGDVLFRSTEAVHGGKEWKNELFGGEEFVALGKRLGGADQRMELLAPDGTVASLATFIDGDDLGQRFRYRLETPPETDMDGKLRLTSTGKDTPEASPKTIDVKVRCHALRRIEIDSLTVALDALSATVRNAEGALGYQAAEMPGEQDTLPVSITVNGEPRDTVLLFRTGADDFDAASATFESGDVVKVRIEADPAKTDFEQMTAEAEKTVG